MKWNLVVETSSVGEIHPSDCRENGTDVYDRKDPASPCADILVIGDYESKDLSLENLQNLPKSMRARKK